MERLRVLVGFVVIFNFEYNNKFICLFKYLIPLTCLKKNLHSVVDRLGRQLTLRLYYGPEYGRKNDDSSLARRITEVKKNDS